MENKVGDFHQFWRVKKLFLKFHVTEGNQLFQTAELFGSPHVTLTNKEEMFQDLLFMRRGIYTVKGFLKEWLIPMLQRGDKLFHTTEIVDSP